MNEETETGYLSISFSFFLKKISKNTWQEKEKVGSACWAAAISWNSSSRCAIGPKYYLGDHSSWCCSIFWVSFDKFSSVNFCLSSSISTITCSPTKCSCNYSKVKSGIFLVTNFLLNVNTYVLGCLICFAFSVTDVLRF